MTDIDVDVVIAVHTVARPIRRAVESVLAASPRGRSRAIVVAHGIPAVDISERLRDLDPRRVHVEEFVDGIRSPSGPFNHGLAVAQAPYLAVLGSDDTLAPGALDAAMERIAADGAEAAILPLQYADGRRVASPLTRWRHTRRLDVVRDRLFARTAPLAVVERSLVERFAPVFDPAFAAGEDIAFGVKLWMTARCVYEPSDPGYVIHEDADVRVSTTAAQDLVSALAAPLALAEDESVLAASAEVRHSLAVKMLRVHLIGAVRHRLEHAAPLRPDEADAARRMSAVWRGLASRAAGAFPRSERGLLDAIATGDEVAMRAAIATAAQAGRFARLVPRNPLRTFDRDAVVRRYVLYALSAWDRRRPR